MEVASLQQPTATLNPPADTMENSMEIDMDLDLGPFPEAESTQTDNLEQQALTTDNGAIDAQTAESQHEKVHIRGVDELTTDDIKRFATDHFPDEVPNRIEWIDDTSANIVYSSEEVGLRALTAFTQLGEEDISTLPLLRLRTAKTFVSHPDSVLQVRSAVKTDRKKPRAHEASRFYLMHPEHDPREKLRRELAEKRRQGVRRDDTDGDYHRVRFDEREHRRRRNRDDGFNVNMYDDDGGVAGDRRGSSVDELSDVEGRRRSRRGTRYQRELFPEGSGGPGRLRNRSASPGRDDLDEMRRSDDEQLQSRRRFRERSPRHSAGGRLGNDREFFSSGSSQDARELFPNKTSASHLKKELFPNKANSNHKRSDAFDAADETADLFSRRMSVPLVDGAQEEIHIKGAANDQGMAIRGQAASGLSIKGNPQAVKELFPNKYNANAGKELFSDTLEGRGGRRRRAEDMFS